MPVELGTAIATATLGAQITSTVIIPGLTVGTAVGYGIASACTLSAAIALAPEAPHDSRQRHPAPRRGFRRHGR